MAHHARNDQMLFKEGTPQSEELLRLAHDTISIWRKLGIVLSLNDSYLDEINDDQTKALDKSYAMLKKWRESFGRKATYARLAEALDHEAIKRLDLVEKYCRDQAAEMIQRMTDLTVSLKVDADGVSKDETPVKVVPSIEILPGKPFHVTHRREKEIQKIEDALNQLRPQNASNQMVTGVFVKGPPGCGKTQLVRQFGEKYMKERAGCEVEAPRRIVATLYAQTPESMLKSYKELHEKLEILKEFEERGSLRERIKAYSDSVKNHLSESSSVWLLIVDNLTVSDPLKEFWPTPEEKSPWGDGVVLITTQDSELVPRSHAHAKVLGLDSGMEQDDAMKLLSAVSGMDTDEDATTVAKLLGYYPLSLACAAVYVRQMREDRPFSNFSWKKYLSNLQKYFAYLDHSDYTHHNPCYPQSMLPAAEFAARRMAETNEVLRAAFVFLSYCALQPVPLDTIAEYVLQQIAASGDERIRVPDDIKLKIARCSLLIYPEAGERGIEVVTLHQVMRLAFTQIRRRPAEKKTGTQSEFSGIKEIRVDKLEQHGVLETLNEAYKANKDELTSDAIAMRIILSPHLKEFVESTEWIQWIDIKLLVQTLVYLADSLVHVAGATDTNRVALLERAYKINKQLCSEELSSALLLCDLGYTYREAGLLDKTIQVLDEADRLCQAHNEPEWIKRRSHLLNVLAFTFRESFKLDLAKEYMNLSVEVTKKAYGESHVQVVERLCNLGVILHDRWENEEAIEVLEEARNIVETCDTSEMVIRAQVLNYTAKVHLRWYLGLRYTHPRVWSTRKHLDESATLHAQALKIYMDHHGDQHKFTTGVMMTYGMVKLQLGELEQAYEMCRKAVEVYRSSGHIAWPRAGTFLADVFLVREEYVHAKKFLEEIIKFHEDFNLVVSPGAYHPKALLAEAVAQLGNVETAKDILTQCLGEWEEQGLHPEHYWVARTRAFLEGLRPREKEDDDGGCVPEL